MATAAVDSSASDHHRNHLHSESIPSIDLHLFSQSELFSLSLCSASSSLHHHQTDPDISTLKIDRSVFNESAGSRKQTFSRIRLAPRNNSQFSPSSSINASIPEQTLDDDCPQIVGLLKSLFGGNSVEVCNVEDNLVSVPVQCNGSVQNGTVLVSDSTAKKRKRGKPPIVDGDSIGKCVTYNLNQDTNARTVDLEEFGNMEDPYARELNRRTLDMQTREQLLEFLQGLDGEWLSKRKKRKIVSASTLGDLLPSGWKLMLCMKNRAGYFWADCRRYISPNGQQFMSCKDASSYLNSSVGIQDASQLSFGPVARNIQMTEKEPSGNAADRTLSVGKNEGALVCCRGLPLSRSVQHEKKSMEGGIPGMAETVRKYKCHNCTMVFDEPDDLLQHFLSSHQKVPKKVRQETLNEEVIFNNGRYECQFCDKSYDERRRYYGHFGNHIKDYFKRIQASGEATRIHRGTMPPLVAVQPSAMKIQESTAIYMGSVSISSNIQSNAEISYDIEDCMIEKNITDESYYRQQGLICSKINDNSGELNDIVVVEHNNVQGGYSKCSHAAVGKDQICARDNVENQHGNLVKGHGHSISTIVDFERVSQVCLSSSLDEKAVFPDDKVHQVSATTLKESRYDDVGGSSNSILSVGSGFNNVTIEDFATGKELESSTRTWIDQTSDAGNEIDGTYRCIATKHGQEKKSEGGTLSGSEQCLGSENTVNKASNDTREVPNHDKVLYVRSSTDNKGADLVASHETAVELESSSGNSLLVPFGNELTFSLEGNEVLNDATKNFVQDTKSDRNPYKGVKSFLEGDTHITFDCSHIVWDTGACKSTIEESYSNNCSLVTSESLWNATEAIVTGQYCSPLDQQKQASAKDLHLSNSVEDWSAGSNSDRFFTGEVKKKLQIIRPKKNNTVTGFRSNTQNNETVMSDFMKKHDEESDLHRSFADTSQVAQSSGCFTTYDLMSYKGGNELFGEKFNGISEFEGLRTGNMENMEYNFMSNHSEESKVFSDDKIALELDSSAWLEKEAVPLLPEMASRQRGPALCIWCKNELHHEDFESETQISSLNFACAACKAKFSSNFS